jgi:hypothetical protein
MTNGAIFAFAGSAQALERFCSHRLVSELKKIVRTLARKKKSWHPSKELIFYPSI